MAWKPNTIWCYDFEHFTRAGRVAIAVMDVVSRYRLATLVSAEKTSTQVEVAFTAALAAAGLDQLLDARLLAALRSGQAENDALDDDRLPVLLAMSETARGCARTPPVSSWPPARSCNASAGPQP